jgi:hypothetical protein
MEIQEQLEQLFARWATTQKQEGLGDWFFPDGLVGEEAAYAAAPIKVLYILKESNVGEEPKDFGFWFKRVVANGEEHPIRRRLALLQEVIADSSNLGVAAYMNLNKSGGAAVADDKQLAAYVQRFAPLIREEIEILAPDVIVCGGCYGLVRDALGDSFTGRLVDMWHPSYWQKSDEDYIAKFREEWERVE